MTLFSGINFSKSSFPVSTYSLFAKYRVTSFDSVSGVGSTTSSLSLLASFTLSSGSSIFTLSLGSFLAVQAPRLNSKTTINNSEINFSFLYSFLKN